VPAVIFPASLRSRDSAGVPGVPSEKEAVPSGKASFVSGKALTVLPRFFCRYQSVSCGEGRNHSRETLFYSNQHESILLTVLIYESFPLPRSAGEL